MKQIATTAARSRVDCGRGRTLWWQALSSAFTLLELLVVVAILGVLCTLLVPVIAKAQNIARATQCVSHLHQLGVAVELLVQDGVGQFPGLTNNSEAPVAMQEALLPYVTAKSLYICPKDPLKPVPLGGSYDWRFTDVEAFSLERASIGGIQNPSAVPIGGDRKPRWHRPDSINVLFADSHAASTTESNWFRMLLRPVTDTVKAD